MPLSINPMPLNISRDNSADGCPLVKWGRAKFVYGECVVATVDGGLCWLDIAPHAESVNSMLRHFRSIRSGQNDFAQYDFRHDNAHAQAALDNAFEAVAQGDELQLYLSGTEFQLQVWRALAQIRSGECETYGELAMRIGRPGAARAVGSAAAANVVALLIPCHRLVPAGSKTRAAGSYRWGAALKQRLLEAEHDTGLSSIYGHKGTNMDTEVHIS